MLLTDYFKEEFQVLTPYLRQVVKFLPATSNQLTLFNMKPIECTCSHHPILITTNTKSKVMYHYECEKCKTVASKAKAECMAIQFWNEKVLMKNDIACLSLFKNEYFNDVQNVVNSANYTDTQKNAKLLHTLAELNVYQRISSNHYKVANESSLQPTDKLYIELVQRQIRCHQKWVVLHLIDNGVSLKDKSVISRINGIIGIHYKERLDRLAQIKPLISASFYNSYQDMLVSGV